MEIFTLSGTCTSPFLSLIADGLLEEFVSEGYQYEADPTDNIRVVFNFIHPDNPRPFRRKAQATFVVSIMEAVHKKEETILKTAYPYLIRSLSNHLIYICHDEGETNVYFITPEQGCYKTSFYLHDKASFFQTLYNRLEPLASSQLVINNEFHDDLPEELWEGDEITNKLRVAGQRLDQLNLLPTPFPIQDYLSPRDMKHLKRLYGIGGLSYGNLSSRKDHTFWMSAAGCNKADMKTIGKDILLVKGYESASKAMHLSVPSNLSPSRVSVDAIEHWMVYAEHPEIGAIIHIHAWIDGVKATEMNYPCGTIQLAEAVAKLIKEQEEPAKAIIGLKNHGLTITGPDLEDIFERIDGRILPQIPMG